MSIIKTLRERGLLNDVTDPSLEKTLEEKKITVYAGFDPTADSLHVGSMVGILVLRHFQEAGHRVIALVGGGTGMIGDPSGRSDERNLLSPEQLERNVEGIRADLARILKFEGSVPAVPLDNKDAQPAILLNNADWLGKFNLIDFLRDVGKNYRVNEMLGKDSVKSRLNNEAGISFTEFSYMLLQGYDFKHLCEHFDCTVQSGGSDQWGNIVGGTDLIRRTLGRQAYGITTPLLLDAAGNKMGKSVSGAVWLNPEKRSPYEFYQYWIGQEDTLVEKFLHMVTLVSPNRIADTMRTHGVDASKREAQRVLALGVTELVHGRAEAEKAAAASSALFGGTLSCKSDAELQSLFSEVPSIHIDKARLDAGIKLADLLAETPLVSSKKDAKRLIEQGGVYLNNSDEAWPAERHTITSGDLASETMLVIRAGRKKYCLVRFST